MVKKSQKPAKRKGEFFFNFNQLRRKLNSKQKQKLITFFSNFRSMFLTVKQHLFQVNKMYDLMEQEYKKFQKDLFKDDEYLSNPKQNNDESQKENDEFQLDDDVMKQILDEGFKDDDDEEEQAEKKSNDNKNNKDINIGNKSENKNFLEKYDIVLDEEISEEQNENNEKEKPSEKFSQKLFDWRKKNK